MGKFVLFVDDSDGFLLDFFKVDVVFGMTPYLYPILEVRAHEAVVDEDLVRFG